MKNSEVIVEELNSENVQELIKKHTPRGVNLGNQTLDVAVNGVISQLRKLGGRRFLLRWAGDKVPRGTTILEQTITWTQNGVVRADPAGDMIGTYERLVEFGGDSGQEHMMIIFLLRRFS